MKLREIEEIFRIGYRHNPKQFYPNSFRIGSEGGRMVLRGRVKRHVGKGFKIVGVLKERDRRLH